MERQPDDEARQRITDEQATPRSDPRLGIRAAAVFRRMDRNCVSLVPVPAKRAETPTQAIFAWAEECEVPADPADLVELAKRLRGSRLLVGEDGVLEGKRITAAIQEQADLYGANEWPAKNKLRMLACRIRGTLGEMGLM